MRILRALLVVAFVGLLVVATASGAIVKERFGFMHNVVGAFCDGSGAPPWDPGAAVDYGTVTFTVKDGIITADVKLKGIDSPGIEGMENLMIARLIQEPDCSGTAVEIPLTPAGNGKVTLSAPVKSDWAFVHVDWSLGFPPDEFMPWSSLFTETFRH
jgi:hypothetical protein